MLSNPKVRAFYVVLGLAILAFAISCSWFFLVVYQRTATVRLENDTTGIASFYIDNKLVCAAAEPNTGCTIKVRVFRPHTLAASTSFGYPTYKDYSTGSATLNAQPDESYRFLACDANGTPGKDCGLPGSPAEPPVY